MNVNYTLDAVGGNIFHVRCETKKDLAFLFLRAQEFYESNNPSFYRKNFKIEDFKDWYCKCFTGQRLFTYPYDWCGFNVPGEQAIAATEGALQIGDNNSFDDAMREIILRCQQKNEKFYLIGTRDSATELHDMNSTFIHEIAHAFYYLDAAKLVAQTPNVTVLIKGESGTGKEDLAKYIHRLSARSEHSYIPINCSALGDQLLESRLFGYRKGAFTGAEKDTPGIFEQANKGTIFLDEIGDISPYMQQSLLRVLQEKKVLPIGGGKQVDVDVRVIAATNRDLVKMCKEGSFRWDLFYRLAVVELELPVVRDYPKKEVMELLSHFFIKISKDLRKSQILRPNKEAWNVLIDYAYPGNIREMENIISRLYVFKEGEIGLNDLPSFMLGQSRTKSWRIVQMEKQHINNALTHFEGNQRQTALALGITINTLKSKLAKYGIKAS